MASRYQDLVDVLYSNGAGGLKVPDPQSSLTTGDTPTDVVVGDLDGDGQLDLATVNIASSTVTGWLGNGVSGFTPLPAPLQEPQNGWGLVVGDVDEDGDADLVTGGPQLALFLGLGGASFAPYQSLGATGDLVALDVRYGSAAGGAPASRSSAAHRCC